MERLTNEECAFCFGTIYPSQKGIADLMGEYAHKKCVVDSCDMLCPECGTLFEQDTERCEFCQVKLKQISIQEARKRVYSRVRHKK